MVNLQRMKTTMKNSVPVVMLLTVLLTACTEKEAPLTPTQIHSRVDSIIAAKTPELKQQAFEDFDRRRSIEVKAKADSMVQAATAPPIQRELLDKTFHP
jgi:major membrane immunogen (membrane-anchored lipoprotein)